MRSFTVLAALVASAVAAKTERTFAVLRHVNKANKGGVLTRCRIDPIVNPNTDAPHQHTVFGGGNFGISSTGDRLLTSNCTTARVKNDKSAYWAPSLLYQDPSTGDIHPVDVYYVNIYYFFDKTDDDIKAFPANLHMFSGDAALRTAPNTNGTVNLDPAKGPVQPASITCPRKNGNADHTTWPQNSDGSMAGVESVTNANQGLGFPLADCDQTSSPMRLDLHFPSCYNPAVDVRDHENNMDFPDSSGNCPTGWTHVPHLFYEFYYDTPAVLAKFPDLKGKRSPFLLSNGDVTAFSLHADFQNGWDPATLQQIIDNCNVGSIGMEKCPGLIGGLNGDDNECSVECPYHDKSPLAGNKLTGWAYGVGPGTDEHDPVARRKADRGASATDAPTAAGHRSHSRRHMLRQSPSEGRR